MKIACIYNMNNFMFTIVRFLRERGLDAHLLLLNEDDHFMPQADSFSEDYKKFTHQLSWFPKYDLPSGHFTDTTPANIKEDLKPYDVIIGCGYAPAFVEYAGLKLDLFIPYGSDFYELPFMKYWPAKKSTINNLYPLLQKEGIEKARYVLFDYTKEQEPVFKKFNLRGKREFIFPPVFYTTDFSKDNISAYYHKSLLYPIMKKLRDDNEFLVFQHSRQSWKNPPDEFSNKRNDILIKAFAIFLKKNKVKSKLILLEYGVDVNASKELIENLEIKESVFWLSKSHRKELFVAISLCDIGVAELGMSFLMYGSVGEFMTMELPFIHNCNMADYEGKYPTLYDNNHADSEESLVKHFDNFLENRNDYKERATKTKQWFMKHIITDPIERITDMIIESAGKPWYKKLYNNVRYRRIY